MDKLDFLAKTFQLLSQSECADLISRCEEKGFAKLQGYDPNYRNNTRLIFTDYDLAQTLYTKMLPYLPQTMDTFEGIWAVSGLNERFRCCKYTQNQKFKIHCDGSFERNADEKSHLTVNIYLNNVSDGGATRFFDRKQSNRNVIAKVQPTAGQCLIFEHDNLHDGQRLGSGLKYLLRTDVMYRRIKS